MAMLSPHRLELTKRRRRGLRLMHQEAFRDLQLETRRFDTGLRENMSRILSTQAASEKSLTDKLTLMNSRSSVKPALLAAAPSRAMA